MNQKCMINGFEVISTYAGINQFTVRKNEVEIGTCWDLETVAKWTETDVEAVKEKL